MELNLDVNISRVIITIVNFCVLYAVLRYFLFKPVTNIISSRQSEVEKYIKNAEEDELTAKNNKLESEVELKKSKIMGKNIIEEYKSKAQALSDDIVKQAHNEAHAIIERAVKEAQREKEKVEHELRKQVVDLALMLSSKTLEESIDEEKHRSLINNFIAKVGT